MAAARPNTWMPMFWGDYLRDTSHLSTAEHGAYMLLIGHYWTTGRPLADDDNGLARITRQTLSAWKKMREIIVAFFDVSDGSWTHHRIDAELDRAIRFVEKQALNGKLGGRPPKPTHKPKPNPLVNPDGNTSSSTPHSQESHGEISGVAASAVGDPGGPPRSKSHPDTAKWVERLANHKPLEGKPCWTSAWGLSPDSAGHNGLIPPNLYREWRANYDREMAAFKAGRAAA